MPEVTVRKGKLPSLSLPLYNIAYSTSVIKLIIYLSRVGPRRGLPVARVKRVSRACELPVLGSD